MKNPARDEDLYGDLVTPLDEADSRALLPPVFGHQPQVVQPEQEVSDPELKDAWARVRRMERALEETRAELERMRRARLRATRQYRHGGGR